MRRLLDALEKGSDVNYLIDTCFLIYCLEKDKMKELESFCSENSVGLSSFNAAELDHIHGRFPGPLNRHLRNFLKQKLIKLVEVDVVPGQRAKEKKYVESFDPAMLKQVHDPSDAVLLSLAAKIRADVLTRDKHHLFTVDVENYLSEYGIKVLKEIET